MAIGRRCRIIQLRGPARPLSELDDKEREGRKDLDQAGTSELVEGSGDLLLSCFDFLRENVPTHRHDAAVTGTVSEADQKTLLDHVLAPLVAPSSFGNVA